MVLIFNLKSKVTKKFNQRLKAKLIFMMIVVLIKM